MDQIHISLDEVTQNANRIQQLSQMMYEQLQGMKREMNRLDESWISNAGNLIVSKFNTFSSRFDRQKDVIDQYVKFLNLTVSSYETLENTIQTNASTLQD